MTIKKMALLRVTPEALRDLLQLPLEVEVIRVEMAPGYRGLLHVVIEGAGWDTPEGGVIMPAPVGIATQNSDAAGNITNRVIDWGLPKGDAQ